MAHFSLTNCKILMGQYDLSGDSNVATLQRSQRDLEGTTFGTTGTKARDAGLKDGVFGMAGLLGFGTGGQDEGLAAGMSLSNVPMLLTLRGAADFDRCKFGVIQQGQYQQGGSVGEKAAWSADGRISSAALINGFILMPGTSRVLGGVGVARQLGALSATQKMYWCVHVYEFVGAGDVQLVLESDDAEAFSTTNQRTSTAVLTAVGSLFGVVNGAITDDWWRITWGMGGGLTSFRAIVGVGIFP